MLDNVLTARIEAAKAWLLAGGLLQEVEWGVPSGDRDERGRVTITYTTLDAFIEQRPALDRWGNRAPSEADNTVFHDPRSTWQSPTSSLFRWGDPPVHTYSVSKIDFRASYLNEGHRDAIRLRGHRDPVETGRI